MTFRFLPGFHYYTACGSEHHVPVYARVCFLGQSPERRDAGSQNMWLFSPSDDPAKLLDKMSVPREAQKVPACPQSCQNVLRSSLMGEK